VLRGGKDGEDQYLFIGHVDLDAAAHDAAVEQLRESIAGLRNLFERRLVRGGRVVVVAASNADADGWVAVLDEIVHALGWKTVRFGLRNIDGHWVAIC
jgi:hypothetical protein